MSHPRYSKTRRSGFNLTICFLISRTLCDQFPSNWNALRSEFLLKATIRQYRIVALRAAQYMKRLFNHRWCA